MISARRVLLTVVVLALGLAALGGLALLLLRDKVPAHAERRTPPPGISRRALAVGALAPDFTLPDSSAQPVSLAAELRQGEVVLIFFRGHWCPYCRDQLTQIQKQLPAFMAAGARVLALSADPVDEARALAGRLGLRFPVLADPERAVIRAYGVEDAENEIAWPAVYLLHRDGVVSFREVSDDYRDRPSAAGLLYQLRDRRAR